MKITDYEVYQLGEPSSQGSATWAGNSILLKLTTSDGTVGYGEAVPTLRVQPVIRSLHEVARVYKGKDPMNTELNIREWHKHDFYLPVSFESTSALSAFDIACWDIVGKHFGAPIHQLVGAASETVSGFTRTDGMTSASRPNSLARGPRNSQRWATPLLNLIPSGHTTTPLMPRDWKLLTRE